MQARCRPLQPHRVVFTGLNRYRTRLCTSSSATKRETNESGGDATRTQQELQRQLAIALAISLGLLTVPASFELDAAYARDTQVIQVDRRILEEVLEAQLRNRLEALTDDELLTILEAILRTSKQGAPGTLQGPVKTLEVPVAVLQADKLNGTPTAEPGGNMAVLADKQLPGKPDGSTADNTVVAAAAPVGTSQQDAAGQLTQQTSGAGTSSPVATASQGSIATSASSNAVAATAAPATDKQQQIAVAAGKQQPAVADSAAAGAAASQPEQIGVATAVATAPATQKAAAAVEKPTAHVAQSSALDSQVKANTQAAGQQPEVSTTSVRADSTSPQRGSSPAATATVLQAPAATTGDTSAKAAPSATTGAIGTERRAQDSLAAVAAVDSLQNTLAQAMKASGTPPIEASSSVVQGGAPAVPGTTTITSPSNVAPPSAAAAVAADMAQQGTTVPSSVAAPAAAVAATPQEGAKDASGPAPVAQEASAAAAAKVQAPAASVVAERSAAVTAAAAAPQPVTAAPAPAAPAAVKASAAAAPAVPPASGKELGNAAPQAVPSTGAAPSPTQDVINNNNPQSSTTQLLKAAAAAAADATQPGTAGAAAEVVAAAKLSADPQADARIPSVQVAPTVPALPAVTASTAINTAVSPALKGGDTAGSPTPGDARSEGAKPVTSASMATATTPDSSFTAAAAPAAAAQQPTNAATALKAASVTVVQPSTTAEDPVRREIDPAAATPVPSVAAAVAVMQPQVVPAGPVTAEAANQLAPAAANDAPSPATVAAKKALVVDKPATFSPAGSSATAASLEVEPKALLKVEGKVVDQPEPKLAQKAETTATAPPNAKPSDMADTKGGVVTESTLPDKVELKEGDKADSKAVDRAEIQVAAKGESIASEKADVKVVEKVQVAAAQKALENVDSIAADMKVDSAATDKKVDSAAEGKKVDNTAADNVQGKAAELAASITASAAIDGGEDDQTAALLRAAGVQLPTPAEPSATTVAEAGTPPGAPAPELAAQVNALLRTIVDRMPDNPALKEELRKLLPDLAQFDPNLQRYLPSLEAAWPDLTPLKEALTSEELKTQLSQGLQGAVQGAAALPKTLGDAPESLSKTWSEGVEEATKVSRSMAAGIQNGVLSFREGARQAESALQPLSTSVQSVSRGVQQLARGDMSQLNTDTVAGAAAIIAVAGLPLIYLATKGGSDDKEPSSSSKVNGQRTPTDASSAVNGAIPPPPLPPPMSPSAAKQSVAAERAAQLVTATTTTEPDPRTYNGEDTLAASVEAVRATTEALRASKAAMMQRLGVAAKSGQKGLPGGMEGAVGTSFGDGNMAETGMDGKPVRAVPTDAVIGTSFEGPRDPSVPETGKVLWRRREPPRSLQGSDPSRPPPKVEPRMPTRGAAAQAAAEGLPAATRFEIARAAAESSYAAAQDQMNTFRGTRVPSNLPEGVLWRRNEEPPAMDQMPGPVEGADSGAVKALEAVTVGDTPLWTRKEGAVSLIKDRATTSDRIPLSAVWPPAKLPRDPSRPPPPPRRAASVPQGPPRQREAIKQASSNPLPVPSLAAAALEGAAVVAALEAAAVAAATDASTASSGPDTTAWPDAGTMGMGLDSDLPVRLNGQEAADVTGVRVNGSAADPTQLKAAIGLVQPVPAEQAAIQDRQKDQEQMAAQYSAAPGVQIPDSDEGLVQEVQSTINGVEAQLAELAEELAIDPEQLLAVSRTQDSADGTDELQMDRAEEAVQQMDRAGDKLQMDRAEEAVQQMDRAEEAVQQMDRAGDEQQMNRAEEAVQQDELSATAVQQGDSQDEEIMQEEDQESSKAAPAEDDQLSEDSIERKEPVMKARQLKEDEADDDVIQPDQQDGGDAAQQFLDTAETHLTDAAPSEESQADKQDAIVQRMTAAAVLAEPQQERQGTVNSTISPTNVQSPPGTPRSTQLTPQQAELDALIATAQQLLAIVPAQVNTPECRLLVGLASELQSFKDSGKLDSSTGSVELALLAARSLAAVEMVASGAAATAAADAAASAAVSAAIAQEMESGVGLQVSSERVARGIQRMAEAEARTVAEEALTESVVEAAAAVLDEQQGTLPEQNIATEQEAEQAAAAVIAKAEAGTQAATAVVPVQSSAATEAAVAAEAVDREVQAGGQVQLWTKASDPGFAAALRMVPRALQDSPASAPSSLQASQTSAVPAPSKGFTTAVVTASDTVVNTMRAVQTEDSSAGSRRGARGAWRSAMSADSQGQDTTRQRAELDAAGDRGRVATEQTGTALQELRERVVAQLEEQGYSSQGVSRNPWL